MAERLIDVRIPEARLFKEAQALIRKAMQAVTGMTERTLDTLLPNVQTLNFKDLLDFCEKVHANVWRHLGKITTRSRGAQPENIQDLIMGVSTLVVFMDAYTGTRGLYESWQPLRYEFNALMLSLTSCYWAVQSR